MLSPILALSLLGALGQVQTLPTALPPPLQARVTANDWAGAADWFETQSPASRGAFLDTWLTALNRSRRWERLQVVCEAVLPQLEAKSDARQGRVRLYRAQALSQLGRHAEAALAHAENGRAGWPDGFANACAEARMAGDWTTLLASAEAVLKAKPEDPDGTAWRGEALARLERFAEAEPVLRLAVARGPQIAFAWNNLGCCLLKRQAWEEACQALDQALALDPRELEARYNRGRARYELKQYAASCEDFKAALALRPDDPVIQASLKEAERCAAPPAKPTGKARRAHR